MKPKLLIVLGPTAVGKSEIALQLAQSINGEIVNAVHAVAGVTGTLSWPPVHWAGVNRWTINSVCAIT